MRIIKYCIFNGITLKKLPLIIEGATEKVVALSINKQLNDTQFNVLNCYAQYYNSEHKDTQHNDYSRTFQTKPKGSSRDKHSSLLLSHS